ncbi:DNA-directed RNA polymerase III complex subunit Rpc25, variant 2 [Entomophthora muscae]|uniref:DNA-directed RNA polymerase III complex subunit Rpc25, variant 2 n=1 Tax=Entomophthora muscae TaxID=34485 RepID=A0ACC2T1G5_9FUNG|nr:DNA-directed RNA polymerase III complex subunit Rpc25, variant 2 [Entomophthora muscae]
MFILTEIKDLVTIQPRHSSLPLDVSISNELNKKYANKVLHNIGLCIRVHDILSAGEAFIYHSDGLSYIKVQFRMIVFRPIIGEVFCGKVKTCSPSGIKVTLHFFDEINVIPELLREDAVYSAENQAWEWDMDGVKLDLMAEDIIKVRVIAETFSESHPVPAKPKTQDQEIIHEAPKVPPYTLTCSIAEDGLGSVSWWE